MELADPERSTRQRQAFLTGHRSVNDTVRGSWKPGDLSRPP